MESLKVLTLFILLLSTFGLNAKTQKYSGVMYFNKMYGQLHKLPSGYSATYSTVECGHPFKVHKKQEVSFWKKVATGPYEGFIRDEFLTKKKPKCFQDKYPKFIHHLNVEITDMYHWAKLYDYYVEGKSKTY